MANEKSNTILIVTIGAVALLSLTGVIIYVTRPKTTSTGTSTTTTNQTTTTGSGNNSTNPDWNKIVESGADIASSFAKISGGSDEQTGDSRPGVSINGKKYF